MKKIAILLYIFFFSIVFAQIKVTEAQADTSNDPKVIANFLKNNPNHPKTAEYKHKLYTILAESNSAIAKPTVKPLTKQVLKKEIKKENAKENTSEKNNNTVAVLNHLFNNSSKSNEAYLQIINKSKCNMIVKINGKKYYNLDVPANNMNFILLEKGTYTLTTKICDAQYTSLKNVKEDLMITMGNK